MYKSTIFNIFNCHVPIKNKYIRANEATFMSKRLSQSHIRNISLKQHRTDTNKKTTSPKEISVKNSEKTLLKLF